MKPQQTSFIVKNIQKIEENSNIVLSRETNPKESTFTQLNGDSKDKGKYEDLKPVSYCCGKLDFNWLYF